jgi:virginiamycin B lyase
MPNTSRLSLIAAALLCFALPAWGQELPEGKGKDVWYADFSRGYLGRLDPATGKVIEWPSPSGPKSEPYGISAINDIIWYSESGTTPNTVVRFDPQTEKFQSWALPGGGNTVRNTSVTREGDFVLANSLVNAVTLVKIPK